MMLKHASEILFIFQTLSKLFSQKIKIKFVSKIVGKMYKLSRKKIWLFLLTYIYLLLIEMLIPLGLYEFTFYQKKNFLAYSINFVKQL